MKEIEAVIVRLASDPDFRAEYGEDPDRAIAAYGLTEPERCLLLYCRPLLALTPEALRARWVMSPAVDGPIWWDSMSTPLNDGV